MKKNSVLTGHLLAIFTAFVWGVTFVSSKVLLRSFSPVELLFDRFFLGYLTLWLLYPRPLALRERRQEWLFAGAGLTGVCLYYLFENVALTYTQAANVSVIVSTAPLFVCILAAFFLKEEKLPPYFLAGFLCAIAGIILLSFGGGDTVQMNPVGDLLSIGAAALWGIYSVLIKKIHALEYPLIAVTRRVFFYGIVFMLPIAAASGYQIGIGRLASPVNLLNLLFLGIIACAVCFLTWNRAVSILGAVKTSAYIYAIPVITLAASMLILKEKVTVLMAAGIILTIVGLVISEKK